MLYHLKRLTTLVACFSFFAAKSQSFYVHETPGNLETILKSSLTQKSDTVVELELKADYVIKVIANFRNSMVRGTVNAVLISGLTGKILYSTPPEKVQSHDGTPTSPGIKRGIKHIVENNLDQIIATAKADYHTRS